MTETLDLLRGRRSVAPHLLRTPGPDPAELQTILEIAARVPDHGKLVPWRFIVIQGDARGRLGEAAARIHAEAHPEAAEARLRKERESFLSAPLVIGLVSRAADHPKIPRWEQALSVGAVAMNLITAATALGFGTCWLTGWIAYDRRIAASLGLSETEAMAGFIHLGTAVERAADRPRPDLAQIVSIL